MMMTLIYSINLKGKKMALKTLKAIKTLGNAISGIEGVLHTNNKEGTEVDFNKTPVVVNDAANLIVFKIQQGPVKSDGKNGCQIDHIVFAAKTILEGLNKNYPCRENSVAITKLDEAIHWLNARKINREDRGVEGLNKA